MYIHIYYIIDKKVIYFVREYDFLRKLTIHFENMIGTFENITFPKQVDYFIRKYDLSK